MKNIFLSVLGILLLQGCGRGGMIFIQHEPANNPVFNAPNSPASPTTVANNPSPNPTPVIMAPSRDFVDTGGPALVPIQAARRSSTPAAQPSQPSHSPRRSASSLGAYCPDSYHSCDECLANKGPNDICVDKRRAAGEECNSNLAAPQCQCWNDIAPGEGPNDPNNTYNWRHLGYTAGDYTHPPVAGFDNDHFVPEYNCLWLRHPQLLDEVAEQVRNR